MKFVIKEHVEMIPDILTVIEKMTKDEGIFFLNVQDTYEILIYNFKTHIYRQADAVRHCQYCWLFMHGFSPTRGPQILHTFFLTPSYYQSII